MSEPVAALPMYDWPEARAETDGAWAAIRNSLRAHGILAPDRLVRGNGDLPPVPGGIRDAAGTVIAPDPATLLPQELDMFTLWRHPALLLAQTCWGPMELGLAEHVAVVGQPDYSAFEGGAGELYSSAILMRRDARFRQMSAELPSLLPVFKGRRFAFNGEDSMSGLVALARDLEEMGERIAVFAERIETGSHRASINAVAEGRADVCAIDCRSWDMAKRFEPKASELAVVGWTRKRKGLPFITSRLTPPETAAALRKILQEPSSRGSRG